MTTKISPAGYDPAGVLVRAPQLGLGSHDLVWRKGGGYLFFMFVGATAGRQQTHPGR